MLEYRARGSAFPKGAPSVYIVYCRPDIGAAEQVLADLLSAAELALWIDKTGDTELSPGSMLEGMSLAVAVVTPELLSGADARAIREIEYFKERNIPVLPILAAPCSTEAYTAMFGAVQYLDRLDTDPTAIRYADKLRRYLDSLFLKGFLDFLHFLFLYSSKVDLTFIMGQRLL